MKEKKKKKLKIKLKKNPTKIIHILQDHDQEQFIIIKQSVFPDTSIQKSLIKVIT